MQTAIVIIILATAVAYAAWRLYDTLSHGGDPCRGCKLADACNKRSSCKEQTASSRP